MNQARNVLQFTIWYQITEKGKVMEDRYLYKAKSIYSGEWVQGYYAFINNHHYIYSGSLCNGGLYVVPEKFVYGVVKWDYANARYVIDDREDGYQDYSEWWQETEVIGNIFDNPELLESEG